MCRNLSHLPANKSGIIHEWQRTLGELVSSVLNHKNSRGGSTSSPCTTGYVFSPASFGAIMPEDKLSSGFHHEGEQLV